MTELPGATGSVDVEGQEGPGLSSSQSPNTLDNAPDHAESMSTPDFIQPPSQGDPPARRSSQARPDDHSRAAIPVRGGFRATAHHGPFKGQAAGSEPARRSDRTDGLAAHEIPFAHMRVHFDDFATQLRAHRHHEYRKRMLSHRRTHLRTAVALSARLHRVGSWVHDGLVEVSKYGDATGFIRVHQHMHALIDQCYTQWDQEIQGAAPVSEPARPADDSFLSNLPPSTQEDCLELLHTLRSNPRFLVERFKVMAPAQVSALSTSPGFQDLSASVLSSLSQNRGRSSQRGKRIKAYSKNLEEYATSFERQNPLSFLLYNIYGVSQNSDSDESKLRLSTWSTICSSLMLESPQLAYDSLLNPVLGAFASLYDWQVKDRLELFLMGVLQKGAFLLDLVENPPSGQQLDFSFFDPLNTHEANEFFDASILELFDYLACPGGLPSGAVQLARAILGRVSSLDVQSQFRGHFVFSWFIPEFLRVAIQFPEDEKMLLQFHVSDKARDCILHQLWNRAYARAQDILTNGPSRPGDSQIQFYVEHIIGQLDPDDTSCNPYDQPHRFQSQRRQHPAFLSVCAADITSVLDALSPQYIATASPWDSFLSSSHNAFSAQYSRASDKFTRLRQRIMEVMEPGSSPATNDPCNERWTSLEIANDGSLSTFVPTNTENFEDESPLSATNFDVAQKAAIRLVENPLVAMASEIYEPTSFARQGGPNLLAMFEEEARIARVRTDSVESIYWHRAIATMRQRYPLTVLTEDDTKVLAPILTKLKADEIRAAERQRLLERDIMELETSYQTWRARVSKLSDQLDKLRVKLWYTINVVTSNTYVDAQNVSTALNNMALIALQGNVPPARRASPGLSRPSTSGTSASSIFDQPRIDTMAILKAPAEHGGPKKLSDAQIELTKKWMHTSNIENVCKGEERIHRFCMEVQMATRNLIGENIIESPVLWSSELFAREKSKFDVQSSAIFNVLPGTRPPSVMSEPLSSASIHSRLGLLGSRASLYSQGSSKHMSPSELASSIGSPGRATTATTLESVSSLWSSHPHSNSRSVTSASLQSRPSSTYDEFGLPRTLDSSMERSKFLEGLQRDLTCLLLSDLGSSVWSRGSETDGWMESLRQTSSSVEKQLQQRATMAKLYAKPDPRGNIAPTVSKPAKARKGRSRSVAPSVVPGFYTNVDGSGVSGLRLDREMIEDAEGGFSYVDAFHDILSRVSHHVDPNLKLKALHDFKNLALNLQKKQVSKPSPSEMGLRRSHDAQVSPRRRSLNSSVLSAGTSQRRGSVESSPDMSSEESGPDIVSVMKRLLFELKPATLFRDLQYVAAFVSSNVLGNSEMGQTFTDVGLAALGWKDEICRSMVDVADRIVVQDSLKRSVERTEHNEGSIAKAMEYWLIAAREGNGIAQRELAGLYLTHPEIPPITSMPLALSSETFKKEMLWEEREDAGTNSKALCLALHWMQQAEKSGDAVAVKKLQDRRAGRSIR